jgi:rod shape-determining protein MreC
MISDYRYHRLNTLRDYMSMVVYPIQWLVDAPMRVTDVVKQYSHTYHQLVQENNQLRQEQLLQNARTQKFMALEAENTRLRSLLQSSPRQNGETLLVAEIIRVDSDPLIHRVILDKGSRQGVTLGQPVIDAEGVIGEVIEVNPLSCRVILLTDASYGIPVENVRTGVRGIAAGTGAIKNLELQHVPNTIDLKPGDTLITSGLDGRYPPGYPVGVISQIFHDPGESFARVQITPSARLERTRQVLLVQRSEEIKQAHQESLVESKTDKTDKTDKTGKEEKIQESKIDKINKVTKKETAQDSKINKVTNEEQTQGASIDQTNKTAKTDKKDKMVKEEKTPELKTDKATNTNATPILEEKTAPVEKKIKKRRRVRHHSDEFDEFSGERRGEYRDESRGERRGEYREDPRRERRRGFREEPREE